MRIDQTTAEKWQRLSSLWREANNTLEQIQLELLTEIGLSGSCKAIVAVEKALQATNGQAYMFTPQSEWMGGDSSDPKNFKFRQPHIMT